MPWRRRSVRPHRTLEVSNYSKIARSSFDPGKSWKRPAWPWHCVSIWESWVLPCFAIEAFFKSVDLDFWTFGCRHFYGGWDTPEISKRASLVVHWETCTDWARLGIQREIPYPQIKICGAKKLSVEPAPVPSCWLFTILLSHGCPSPSIHHSNHLNYFELANEQHKTASKKPHYPHWLGSCSKKQPQVPEKMKVNMPISTTWGLKQKHLGPGPRPRGVRPSQHVSVPRPRRRPPWGLVINIISWVL